MSAVLRVVQVAADKGPYSFSHVDFKRLHGNIFRWRKKCPYVVASIYSSSLRDDLIISSPAFLPLFWINA